MTVQPCTKQQWKCSKCGRVTLHVVHVEHGTDEVAQCQVCGAVRIEPYIPEADPSMLMQSIDAELDRLFSTIGR
jgi:transcription elongation factor Elf1